MSSEASECAGTEPGVNNASTVDPIQLKARLFDALRRERKLLKQRDALAKKLAAAEASIAESEGPRLAERAVAWLEDADEYRSATLCLQYMRTDVPLHVMQQMGSTSPVWTWVDKPALTANAREYVSRPEVMQQFLHAWNNHGNVSMGLLPAIDGRSLNEHDLVNAARVQSFTLIKEFIRNGFPLQQNYVFYTMDCDKYREMIASLESKKAAATKSISSNIKALTLDLLSMRDEAYREIGIITSQLQKLNNDLAGVETEVSSLQESLGLVDDDDSEGSVEDDGHSVLSELIKF